MESKFDTYRGYDDVVRVDPFWTQQIQPSGASQSIRLISLHLVGVMHSGQLGLQHTSNVFDLFLLAGLYRLKPMHYCRRQQWRIRRLHLRVHGLLPWAPCISVVTTTTSSQLSWFGIYSIFTTQTSAHKYVYY